MCHWVPLSYSRSGGCANVAHISLTTTRRFFASRFSAASFLKLSSEEQALHTPGVCAACARLRAADPRGWPVVSESAEQQRAKRACEGTSGADTGQLVRPDFIMLRVISASLIMWDSVEPSEEWVRGQLDLRLLLLSVRCFVSVSDLYLQIRHA